MVLFKEHIQKKKAGKNEARQKYNKTHNICTNMFSANVWKQAQRLPPSTEVVTHFW